MKQNKITTLLYTLTLTLSALTVTAQQKTSDYKISDFKYRTEGYKLLRLNADFDALVKNAHIDTDPEKRFFIAPSSLLEYAKSLSLENKQRFLFAQANLGPFGIDNNTLGANKTNSSVGSVGGKVSDLHRVYKKNYFIEFGGNIETGFSSQKTKINDSVAQNYKNTTLALGLNIGVGKGRLENVTDAQTALFILNDLYEIGSAQRVDAAMADKFARYITQLRNGRVFDLRQRTKHQLKAISVFLKENGIIKTAEADEISIINDNMYFSFNNDFSVRPYDNHSPYEIGTRQYSFFRPYNGYLPDDFNYYFNSGGDIYEYPDYVTEFAVQNLQPGADQSQRMAGTKIYARVKAVNLRGKTNFADYNAKGIVAQAGIEKHMPVNMHWQKALSLSIMYLNTRSGTNTYLRFYNESIINPTVANSQLLKTASSFHLQGRYLKGYYPNGRTSIEGVFDFSLIKANFIEAINTSIKQGGLSFIADPKIRGTYFVNNNTVVRGGVSIYFYSELSSKNTARTYKPRSFQFGLEFSILHTLF